MHSYIHTYKYTYIFIYIHLTHFHVTAHHQESTNQWKLSELVEAGPREDSFDFTSSHPPLPCFRIVGLPDLLPPCEQILPTADSTLPEQNESFDDGVKAAAVEDIPGNDPCQGKGTIDDMELFPFLSDCVGYVQKGSTFYMDSTNGTPIKIVATGDKKRPYAFFDRNNCTGVADRKTKGVCSQRSGNSCSACYHAWAPNKNARAYTIKLNKLVESDGSLDLLVCTGKVQGRANALESVEKGTLEKLARNALVKLAFDLVTLNRDYHDKVCVISILKLTCGMYICHIVYMYILHILYILYAHSSGF
jgi:hypothetical protein